MPNTVFVAENMASTKLSSLLKSGRYVVGGNNTAIDNGCVVVLGALEANQREVHTVGNTAAAANPVYIVDSPEVIYSQETTNGLNDYDNAAGAVLRLRKPAEGDHFAVSARGITALGAAPVVGNSVVTPAAGNTLAEIAVPVGTESFIGLIESSYVLGADPIGGRNITMYSILVQQVL